MKTGVIIAMLVALTLAVVLYVCLVHITREHIKQDRQEGATAPCEPADPCDTCNRWDECNGVDKENCPMWRDNEEV